MSEPDQPPSPCPQAAGLVSCQECVEFLMDYLDGRLPEDQRFKFESHIALCADCHTYVENYRKTSDLVRSVGTPDATPNAVPAGLVEAILRARRHEQS